MGGGKTIPGFPCANPTTSYWQTTPHRIANHRTSEDLPTSHVFDYIIIGSGISGAATAYKLLSGNPSLSVLMLEARKAASGASGRNGGHCRAGWWLDFTQYVDAFGEDEALRFERLEEENVRDIAAFVKEHNVDCDFQDVETADVFVEQEKWKKVLATVEAREEVRQRRVDAMPLTQRKVWHGEEAQNRLGMRNIVGAVTYPAHTQNPYLLVCRMLELCLEKGLNLQTNTPALAVRQVLEPSNAGCRWHVTTDRGNVCTRTVVLATNGYTNALLPDLAATEFLRPARSQVTAIRPGTNIANNPALRRSAGLDIGRGDYFMSQAPGSRGEGDIIWGGGRSASDRPEDANTTDDTVVNPEIAEYLHHAGAQFFGREAWGDEGDVMMDWSGITCYTPDTFPLVGEMPGSKGLWASVGMNGHGMAMAFRSAEALVHMMISGKEPEWFPRAFRIARAWSGEKR